jgi:hypothetical protein
MIWNIQSISLKYLSTIIRLGLIFLDPDTSYRTEVAILISANCF